MWSRAIRRRAQRWGGEVVATDLSGAVVDTFDWYSPCYQSHHTYPEVWQWFDDNGLAPIRVLAPPVAMGGYER